MEERTKAEDRLLKVPIHRYVAIRLCRLLLLVCIPFENVLQISFLFHCFCSYSLLHTFSIYRCFLYPQIGDFTKESPSTAQLNSASALIAELVHQKKIASNYSIFGIQHIKKAHHDGSALFEVTSKWKRWDELLTIY